VPSTPLLSFQRHPWVNVIFTSIEPPAWRAAGSTDFSVDDTQYSDSQKRIYHRVYPQGKRLTLHHPPLRFYDRKWPLYVTSFKKNPIALVPMAWAIIVFKACPSSLDAG
jgi:hypothetical protein